MSGTHDVNIPEVVAEVTACFEAYEAALTVNDLDALAGMFWNSELTLRYGPNGTLLGHTAIDQFRRNRNTKGVDRRLQNTVIKTFGRDLAMADTEATRPGENIVSRQSQCWVRMPEGWRIVSAHVSDIPGSD